MRVKILIILQRVVENLEIFRFQKMYSYFFLASIPLSTCKISSIVHYSINNFNFEPTLSKWKIEYFIKTLNNFQRTSKGIFDWVFCLTPAPPPSSSFPLSSNFLKEEISIKRNIKVTQPKCKCIEIYFQFLLDILKKGFQQTVDEFLF